jgi:hypothetical protein
MAAGTKSNFAIYHAEFFSGMSEVLAQNAEVFNAASMNCLRLVTRMLRGDYEKQSFMAAIAAASLIKRRDITDVSSAVDDTPLTQAEQIGVKVNRQIGPVADTLDAWRKIAPDEDAQRLFSFQLGKQIAAGVALDYLNTLLIALQAALDNTAAVEHDATDGTMQFTDLNTGLSKLGDRSSRILAFVMHSHVFHSLVGDGLANYVVENVAGMQIVSGPQLQAMGKRLIVTDSSALVTAATPLVYSTLGLVMDAGEVAESEEQEIQEDIITGKPNLILRIQGEHAFNVKLKGYKWKVATGANPTDGALGTGSNWEAVASDVKDGPGIIIKSA